MVALSWEITRSIGNIRHMASRLLFRAFEWCFALVCIMICIPFWFIHFLLARFQGQSWLRKREMVGAGEKPFHLLEATTLQGFGGRVFNRSLLKFSPRLFNIIIGQLSFVGPGLIEPIQAERLDKKSRERFRVVPGLVSSYYLRKSVNIAFADEHRMALEDTALVSPVKKVAMIARGFMALFLKGGSDGTDCDELDMFGLLMTNESRGEAVTRVISMAEGLTTSRVAFVNPGCVNIAMKDPAYRSVLENNDVIFPDGIGIKIACRYLGLHMRDNLNGTDLFPALCERLEHSHHGIYLLGARPGVCEAMVENIHKKWPKLKISGFRHGYIESEDEENQVLADINRSGASILFVAMGVPAQELWIDKAINRLDVKVVLGVGGLFDFVSGRIPRAPQWVREIGMEWCYRLLKEPRRLWRRYVIGNFVFLWHMVRYHK